MEENAQQNGVQKEVAITYETLYELSRREKSREELQPLDTGFLFDVLTYLREKQRILDEAEQKQDIFSLDEREKTQLQLVNIRKIVRELYERREKKIVEMALNKSRTKSHLIDTTPLHVHEQYLFGSIVSVLDNFRASVLHNVLSLHEPALSPDTPALPKPVIAVQPLTPTLPTQQPASTVKVIKFTKPVEQFVGQELELYGPFQPDQQEQLPADIANILIEQGSAIEVLQE